jgi:aminopeptidase N
VDAIFTLGAPSGNRFWYPVNEHPSDKATYSARYTVPEPYVVEGNGSLVATIDNGQTTTFAWESRDPIASYLVILHAGLLEVEELEGPHGLPIRLSFAPNVPESQREMLRRMPQMVAFAESVFGPYPFESIGGTVTSTRQTLALETQTLPIYGSLGDSRDAEVSARRLDIFEVTVVHELAHQWFGDSVSVQTWQDIWLNEGFSSYAEALWLEKTRGEEARDELLDEFYRDNASAARWSMPGALDGLTGADVLDGLAAVGGPPDDPCYGETLGVAPDAFDAVPAGEMIAALAACGVPTEFFPGQPVLTGDPGGPHLFSYTSIYGRGALTVHALRLEIGDEAFFTLVRAWTTRHSNGNAATVDFTRLAEEISGQDLDAFFDAWLFELPLPPLVLP